MNRFTALWSCPLLICAPALSIAPTDLINPDHIRLAQEEVMHAPALPFDPQGWCSNTEQLHLLIRKTHPSLIVEVGSWKGCSTFAMSQVLPSGAKIYCVDHWLGSPEHQPGGSAYQPGLENLYEIFLSNIRHWQLADCVVPVRGASLEVARFFPLKADLIYIDAAHETEAVYADLQAWLPLLSENGVMCGDDWSWPSVRRAVERFAAERGLPLFTRGNFWSFFEFDPPNTRPMHKNYPKALRKRAFRI